MIVYHGSYTKITKIDLSKCEPRKDFGKGFYVTNIQAQAEIWAERIGKKYNQQGVVTEFIFYENAFIDGVYKVLRFDKYDEQWLDFVTSNRRLDSPIPAHDYDIVEGPIADDRISREIDNYISGKISREKFLNMLRREEATHQICFCTADSLLMLELKDKNSDIGYEISEIGESLLKELVIGQGIDEEQAADLFYSSNTFGKLADISTELYKKSWQEIYEMLKLEFSYLK
ncbi:DUF3990 domain-containing protein [Odoribacter sp. OttesenSCG-928-L07]|nr:DUF3990 domain-containing protein [Odoribacter sp. OttesenSCG-928-L07]MDL2239099.1 DUF3990 domain-containing protein [Bacteroidales bacterium OttesenSCG-928-L14]MDL2240012.1 DUF3990 domain-containing protein [Bacteroidales bacterium OttesenSCG-928-K22]